MTFKYLNIRSLWQGNVIIENIQHELEEALRNIMRSGVGTGNPRKEMREPEL